MRGEGKERRKNPGPFLSCCRKPARPLLSAAPATPLHGPAFTAPALRPGERRTQGRGLRPGPRNPPPPAASPTGQPSERNGCAATGSLPWVRGRCSRHRRSPNGRRVAAGRSGVPRAGRAPLPPRRVGRRALPARYHSAGPGQARSPPLRPLAYTLAQ